MTTPTERARAELACRLIDLHELTGTLAEHVLSESDAVPGELINFARRVRLLSVTVPAAALRLERAAGVEWAVIADALGVNEDEAWTAHEGDYQDWLAGEAGPYPGLPPQLGMPATRWADEPGKLARELGRWLGRRRGKKTRAVAAP